MIQGFNELLGGSGEIRTHGGLSTLDGFQDRCIKPLCHASVLRGVHNTLTSFFAQAFFAINLDYFFPSARLNTQVFELESDSEYA